MSEDQKKITPAYATYKSFSNLINDLRENGIPPHIVYSVVKGSNSGKATMMASLKSLGLVDEDKVPTAEFISLIEEKDNYKSNLSAILAQAYPFLFDGSIDLSNTTTEMVAEKFKAAGAGGSTISKGMAFFLSAAKEAGIAVSSRVKPPQATRTGSSGKRNNSASRSSGNGNGNGNGNGGQTPLGVKNTPAAGGESRSVELSSGGKLTISASTGWLSLSTEDRNFVFGLIDKLTEYEQKKKQTTNEVEDERD